MPKACEDKSSISLRILRNLWFRISYTTRGTQELKVLGWYGSLEAYLNGDLEEIEM
jgi:hypothetical protein